MINRVVTLGLLGLGTLVLFGCPIYPSDHDQRVCVDNDCYACPDAYYSSDCSGWMCHSSSDCPSSYACTSDHRCRYTGTPNSGGTCNQPSDCAGGSCGADNRCHTGDCSTSGCPSDFVCSLSAGSGGVPKCVPGGDGGGGVSSTCKKDSDCSATAGSKCLSGSCVKPEDQCVDATQCTGDAQCVQGACTPTCSATKACPTGYGCDLAKGVCTQNPSPCGTGGATCSGGKVCVEEHCVDACGAGGTCAVGLVCVDGGCTPDEKPVFVCTTDGVQGACSSGSLCLRHACYIGCDTDAGADVCKTSDKFNQCKAVTTASGTFHVCGSTSNLGTQCGPSTPCASPAICIDGYCK